MIFGQTKSFVRETRYPLFRIMLKCLRLGHKPGNAPSVEGLQRKLGPFTFFRIKRT